MHEVDAKREVAYRADIQGLRALAVVVVVLFHAGFGFPGGFVGVDVFFVVSGYVITRMLRREQDRTGTLRLGNFYLRRIRRLLPALALVLVVGLLATPWLGPVVTQDTSRRTGAAGALFVSNVTLARGERGYFAPDAEANPFLHLWSLSVEEQYYLAFPLVLLAVGAAVRRRRRPVAVLAAVLGVAAVASFALNLFLLSDRSPFDAGYSQQLAFFMSPPRAWEFLAGALASLGSWRSSRGRAELLGGAGLVLVAAAVFGFDGGTLFPGAAALVPVVGAVALLVAGDAAPAERSEPSRLAVVSASPPLVWLGDRSYSWYLWHWPLIVFARASFPEAGWAPVLAAAVSLAPAAASYRWLESPIRHRTVPAWRTLAMGAACVVLPLVAVGGARALLDHQPSSVDRFTHAFDEHGYVAAGCDDHDPDTTPEDCTWAPPSGAAPKGHAVLVGDSNAGQLHEAFLAAAAEQDMTATVQTRASCSFLDLHQFPDAADDRACQHYRESRLEWMARTRPDVVVLAGVSDLRISRDDDYLADRDGRRLRTPEEKATAWEASLVRTLRRLDALGIRAIVLHPVPRLPAGTEPGLCSALRVVIDQSGCGTTSVEAEIRPAATLAYDAENAALRRVPGSQGLDLWSVFCHDGLCPAFHDGIWWYRDANHISLHASELLGPRLARALGAALKAG